MTWKAGVGGGGGGGWWDKTKEARLSATGMTAYPSQETEEMKVMESWGRTCKDRPKYVKRESSERTKDSRMIGRIWRPWTNMREKARILISKSWESKLASLGRFPSFHPLGAASVQPKVMKGNGNVQKTPSCPLNAHHLVWGTGSIRVWNN